VVQKGPIKNRKTADLTKMSCQRFIPLLFGFGVGLFILNSVGAFSRSSTHPWNIKVDVRTPKGNANAENYPKTGSGDMSRLVILPATTEKGEGRGRMDTPWFRDRDGTLDRNKEERAVGYFQNRDVTAMLEAAEEDAKGGVTLSSFEDALHASRKDNDNYINNNYEKYKNIGTDGKENPRKSPQNVQKTERTADRVATRTGTRQRPYPYFTFPPPHSPEEPEEPDTLEPELVSNPKRKHYIFTVDNRDVRGSGYRPLVAAANQLYATMMPLVKGEQQEYMYLRSNLSCDAREDCPSPFPNAQVNKICCTGPVNDGSIRGVPPPFSSKPTLLHPSWMDLKGILYMLDNVMKRGDMATYLDSDAHFDVRKQQSFHESFEWMLPELFNGTRPIAVVRDRSAWTGVCGTDFGGPYTMDSNSGIIMFTKNRVARNFFERLYFSALTPSPQDIRLRTPLYYQFGWPHEQERLTWFASTPVENASITYIQRMGWTKELPWCYQAICHRNFDKMPYIEEYIRGVTPNSKP